MTAVALSDLAHGPLGTFDLACPTCGPERRSPANRVRKVLRIWRNEPGFATFHCVRCGAHGYSRDERRSTATNRASHAVRAEIEARDRQPAAEQRRKAQWLWRRRRPAQGTLVEHYLREVRGIVGPIPPTIGSLPATDVHPPAMIGAIGPLGESEPGSLAVPSPDQIKGVHLTRLLPDGSGKAGEPAKIMIGRSIGSPIVLAPLNDLLGLTIVEGIETGLSIRDATGLGVWAAGAASRMPALADVVPGHVDCVTVVIEDDEAGRGHAAALLDNLARRGLPVEPLHLARAVDGV